jgi:hypothetical protein
MSQQLIQVQDGLDELGDGAGQTAAQRLQCMQRTLKTYTDTVQDAARVSDTHSITALCRTMFKLL